MFSSVPMTQINVASPVSKLDDVLEVMEKLGCIHIQPYTQFEEGVGIGKARSGEEADKNSTLLAKARALVDEMGATNDQGPMKSSDVEKLLSGGFEESMDEASSLQGKIVLLENDIRTKGEELKILEILAPLNLPLDLLTGSKSMEVYVAQTKKGAKIMAELADVKDDIIAEIAPNVIAIACSPSVSSDVQVVLATMGAKVVQIPSGEGSPGKISAEFAKEMKSLESDLADCQKRLEEWGATNGRKLVCVHELLSRKVEIDLAPTNIAVSKKAFAIDAWTPSSNAAKVKSELEKVAPYVETSEYVDDHHHHDDHADDHHHSSPSPPTEYDNPDFAKPFELMVDLVGRPAYGKFDPTLLMMFTFPMLFGFILGDFGFGAIIAGIGLFLKSKAVDPAIKNGMNIMIWMGVWCMFWGFVFAEGFGFVWDNSTVHMQNSPLAGIYAVLYEISMPAFLTDTLGMSHLKVPWHRASKGHGLEEYVMISVYLGVVHLFLGFVIGFISVLKAHGIAAAYFEKGSWILILTAGFVHSRGMLRGYNELLEVTPALIIVIIGILSLIVGLAVYEKFGWAGGVIMGPIETFGLLANTLSYLRVMGVGVAGVKIVEVSITMGWESMITGFTSGTLGGIITGLLAFLIFLGVQAFALALGVLSPSIHAARLHFVEWMGKFYDGSGTAFKPLGGKSLHVEG